MGQGHAALRCTPLPASGLKGYTGMGCLSFVASGLAQLVPGRPPCCLAAGASICYISFSGSPITADLARDLMILVM